MAFSSKMLQMAAQRRAQPATTAQTPPAMAVQPVMQPQPRGVLGRGAALQGAITGVQPHQLPVEMQRLQPAGGALNKLAMLRSRMTQPQAAQSMYMSPLRAAMLRSLGR